MIKEALQYIVGLRQPNFHTDSEREWSDMTLHPVQAPIVSLLEVSSLSGFLDLVQNKFEDFPAQAVIAHVENYDTVNLVSRLSDEWRRRVVYIKATPPEVRGFTFGTFMDHESFVIGVQAWFDDSPDREYLLKVGSNVTSSKVQVSEDDGVSQEVTLKQGAVLKEVDKLKRRVTLAPFRTFREVAQPASEFVFRVRGGDEKTPPALALFEADGGKWQHDAMEEIGRYLRADGKLGDIPVVV